MQLDINAWLRYPKIDMHCHAWNLEDEAKEAISAEQLIRSGDMLGISEYWCSSPIVCGRIGTVAEVGRENDAVLRMMRRFPQRIRGWCFVIPAHYQGALDEIERCLDLGMIGIKLYNQYRIDEAAVYPVIEKAIERKVPILEHAGFLQAREHLDNQPRISNGLHFAAVNQVYPEAMLIHAHTGGGGDWEQTLRAMRHTSPNLYCDISGSNLDDGQVEQAVADMGPDRVLFGTDGTMAGSVGKVIDATLDDPVKERIFWDNAAAMLAPQGATPLHQREEVAT
ncbi:MAG: amidohydrolase family protein [Candidatus Latescibacteria bacterium]|nr:amidohydrolase family protein [Candidatus Latescibacterota bacterium]